MNTEKFTGKAAAYAKARPSYAPAAIEYITTLTQGNGAVADIGAGTGKLSILLAQAGYRLFAVEPNHDMRAELLTTLSPFPNAQIIAGTAESTTLPSHSVDVITCAQALHWFDPAAFHVECKRIGTPHALVIAVYNNTPGGSSSAHSTLSTSAFFSAPTIRTFPNPLSYTREQWLQFMVSHSHSPLPTDPEYAAHIEAAGALFDRESIDDLLRRENVTTTVYSQRLDW